MKFVTYERRGALYPGFLTEDGAAVEPLAVALGRPVADLTEFIRTHTPEDLAMIQAHIRGGGGQRIPLDETGARLVAPIRRPIHDILCVGTNYHDHIREVRKGIDPAMTEAPKATIYFTKRAAVVIGPGEAIECHQALDPCLDYEVELAVVIGKEGRDIPPERAEEYIFGYSIFNDVSARTLQKRHSQWFRGKSLDTFSAMGPAIVHASALPFPLELEIRSTVNGEARQQSNTRQMVAGVAEIIHTLSQGMTLEPGDIIATGTPAGVGMGFEPPRYMQPGDLVCCEIQGIGSLSNPVLE